MVSDIVVLQPSSAFRERLFSVLPSCTNERQESALSNRIAAAVLTKYSRGKTRASAMVRAEKKHVVDEEEKEHVRLLGQGC